MKDMFFSNNTVLLIALWKTYPEIEIPLLGRAMNYAS